MNALEYLQLYLIIKAQWENRKRERDSIIADEALPAGIDYAADKVQKSPKDAMLNKVLRIQKRVRHKDELIAECERKMDEICDNIAKIPDWRYQRILHMTFVQNMTDAEIGDQIGYSEKWVMKLRKQGVAEMEKVLEEWKKQTTDGILEVLRMTERI